MDPQEYQKNLRIQLCMNELLSHLPALELNIIGREILDIFLQEGKSHPFEATEKCFKKVCAIWCRKGLKYKTISDQDLWYHQVHQANILLDLKFLENFGMMGFILNIDERKRIFQKALNGDFLAYQQILKLTGK